MTGPRPGHFHIPSFPHSHIPLHDQRLPRRRHPHPHIGNFAGTLAPVRTDDLAALATRGLMDRHPELDPAAVEDVILGCANQAGEDNRNVARMAGLLAGLPVSVPGER